MRCKFTLVALITILSGTELIKSPKSAFSQVQVTMFICMDTKELGHQEHFLLPHCPQTSILPCIIQCVGALNSKTSGMESCLVSRTGTEGLCHPKNHLIHCQSCQSSHHLEWVTEECLQWSLARGGFRWFHLWLTSNKLLLFPFPMVIGLCQLFCSTILMLPWRKELIEINLELF